MAIRLGTIPVVIDWRTVQDTSKGDYDPPSCYDTNENEGDNAKYVDRKEATVKGED